MLISLVRNSVSFLDSLSKMNAMEELQRGSREPMWQVIQVGIVIPPGGERQNRTAERMVTISGIWMRANKKSSNKQRSPFRSWMMRSLLSPWQVEDSMFPYARSVMRLVFVLIRTFNAGEHWCCGSPRESCHSRQQNEASAWYGAC